MKIAQFRCESGVTILLDEQVAAKCSHVRVTEWVEVEFTPREPATAEELAALDAEEKLVQHALNRIAEKRAALQESVA